MSTSRAIQCVSEDKVLISPLTAHLRPSHHLSDYPANQDLCRTASLMRRKRNRTNTEEPQVRPNKSVTLQSIRKGRRTQTLVKIPPRTVPRFGQWFSPCLFGIELKFILRIYKVPLGIIRFERFPNAPPIQNSRRSIVSGFRFMFCSAQCPRRCGHSHIDNHC